MLILCKGGKCWVLEAEFCKNNKFPIGNNLKDSRWFMSHSLTPFYDCATNIFQPPICGWLLATHHFHWQNTEGIDRQITTKIQTRRQTQIQRKIQIPIQMDNNCPNISCAIFVVIGKTWLSGGDILGSTMSDYSDVLLAWEWHWPIHGCDCCTQHQTKGLAQGSLLLQCDWVRS